MEALNSDIFDKFSDVLIVEVFTRNIQRLCDFNFRFLFLFFRFSICFFYLFYFLSFLLGFGFLDNPLYIFLFCINILTQWVFFLKKGATWTYHIGSSQNLHKVLHNCHDAPLSSKHSHKSNHKWHIVRGKDLGSWRGIWTNLVYTRRVHGRFYISVGLYRRLDELDCNYIGTCIVTFSLYFKSYKSNIDKKDLISNCTKQVQNILQSI